MVAAPVFSYEWNNGMTGQTASNLIAGEYEASVTDNNNCMTSIMVTIGEPDELTSMVDAQSDALCNGSSNGSASLSAQGGTTPYSFNWPDAFEGDFRSDLAAGSYEVTIVDNMLCESLLTVDISEPEELLANAAATDETGPGNNDGGANAEPTGGSPPYTYEWSTGETISQIFDLAPGDYIVTVRDENQCESIETVTVPSIWMQSHHTNRRNKYKLCG